MKTLHWLKKNLLRQTAWVNVWSVPKILKRLKINRFIQNMYVNKRSDNSIPLYPAIPLLLVRALTAFTGAPAGNVIQAEIYDILREGLRQKANSSESDWF